MDQWAFGCDVCQTVCPWNRFAKQHNEVEFEAHQDLLKLSKIEWEEMTEEVFETLFRDSALQRKGFKGLQGNIRFLSQ